jgi:hypothetical protein
VPNDSRSENFDCPFDPDDLEPSSIGQAILAIICAALCVLSIVVAGIVWAKWRRVKIAKFDIVKQWSQSDVLLAITICVEFF